MISGRRYCVSLNMAILYTELYNFVWSILTNYLSTEYRKDLRLGKVDRLLVAYNIANSWLLFRDSFDFFSLRDSENQQLSCDCVILPGKGRRVTLPY